MGEATRPLAGTARVGVVSKAPILTDGLAALLDEDPMLTCVMASSDVASALAMLHDGKLDALVLDDELLDDDLLERELELGGGHPGMLVVLRSGVERHDLIAGLGARSPGRIRVVDKRAGLAALADSLRGTRVTGAGGPVAPPAG